MNISNSFKPLSEAEITSFEVKHSLKLPLQYRYFLAKHNGGSPDPATFDFEDPILGKSNSIVNKFAGMHEGQVDSLARYIVTHHDRIPEDLLPIARDWFGNLICLCITGENHGKVYFWDHEQEGEPDNEGKMRDYQNIYFIAQSFDGFLNNLYEHTTED